MLELAPEIEKTVREQARHAGLTESDYIARLVQTAAGQQPKDVSPPPANATETLFAQWDEEDAHMTEAEQQEEDTFWDEFAIGIDESRASAGMRLIF